MKILVVEDDKLSREAVVSFLVEDLKFDVEEAEDGYEALEILTQQRFDLVVSDVRMPKIDGIELLKNSKKLYPQTEVILMTGFAEVHDAVSALRLGALDYLMKPINIEELGITIQNLEERNRLRTENATLRESLNMMGKDVSAARRQIKSLQQTIREVQHSENMAIFSEHMKKVVNIALQFHEKYTQKHNLD